MPIYIGLTGSLAAGKGVVSEFLKDRGFVYISLSDELREIAKEKKLEVTRKNLQDLGNILREEQGAGVLALKVVEKIRTQNYEKAIIDGIRNPAEIVVLKKLKNFCLIAVDAPQDLRFKRMLERNRESDPKTWEAFLDVDNRDKGFGESATGQAVAKCMEQADHILFNFGGLDEIQEKVKKAYEKVERSLPRLSWDEYFMEIAKAVAKRATCDRGRSGCVIAKDKQILVSGYVGSPKGLPHCDEVGHQMKQTVHEDGTITNHCVRTTHAEQNAICQAAKLGVPIDGATIYVRMTPCIVCAKMIINSGIKRVVCEEKYHAGRESEEMLKQAGIPVEFFSDDVVKYEKQ